MTRSELIEKIEAGNDIMFDVSNHHYTILTWTDDGIAIGEQYPNDRELRYYETAEKLVDSFMIDGKSLSALAEQVKITQYT